MVGWWGGYVAWRRVMGREEVDGIECFFVLFNSLIVCSP